MNAGEKVFWYRVSEEISRVEGDLFEGQPLTRVSGGSINRATRLGDRRRDRHYFVKWQSAEFAANFAAEAWGLNRLAATKTVAVPRPICHGTAAGNAFLALEWLDLAAPSSGSWQRLGQGLAALHRVPVGTRFGMERDNFIGATPQLNPLSSSWATFFLHHRLDFQVALARRNGMDFPRYQRLREVVPALLGSRKTPSLLHGDLWSGNAAFTRNGVPVLFDAAVYWGDAEVDLAMSRLFGGFPEEFYRAYEEILPMAGGCRRRQKLYNLYHILNHFNLFGGAYGLRADRLMAELLAES